MLKDNIALIVKDFVATEAQVPENDPGFTEDVHLFESGYMDSLGVVRLIDFIETAFGVKLDETHLFSEEFTTIGGIATLTEAALHAGAAEPNTKPPPDQNIPPMSKNSGNSSWFQKVRRFNR